ncbi:hypothetical protein CMI38_05830 [Candidatus Pacearchaeota archaeon]|nr:hypothetical protein [Candidatus Pacearchaeota archaeon]
MNKKGWIRIVEMFIAIMIIATAVLLVASKQVGERDISSEVYEKQRQIFEVVGSNDVYREEIIGIDLSGGCVNLNRGDSYGFIDYIDKSVPNSWDFVVNLCKIGLISNKGSPNDKEVFVSESVISAVVDDYPNEEPRKMRLSVWGK